MCWEQSIHGFENPNIIFLTADTVNECFDVIDIVTQN